MHVQTLAVLGTIPRPLLYQGVVLRQRPTQIAITPSSHLGYGNLSGALHYVRCIDVHMYAYVCGYTVALERHQYIQHHVTASCKATVT